MKINRTNSILCEFLAQSPVIAAIVAALAAQLSATVALANGAYGTNVDIAGKTISVPTYYANSPQGIQPAWDPVKLQYIPGVTVDTGTPLRKFVDPLAGAYNGLGGLPGATGLNSGIPLAITAKWVNPAGVATTDDYYEIAVVEYTERMHSDLAKETRLRGYVQIETDAIRNGNLKDITGLLGSEHIAATYPDGTPIYDLSGRQVYFVHPPHYLGPVILAAKGTPVRLKVTNYLPYTDSTGKSVGSWNGQGGESFIPVDETIAGGGPVLTASGAQALDANGKPIKMGQNRVAIHWHGGDSPWISDGTPHQWFAPARDIAYTIGIDAAHANGMGKGDSAVNVPDMPDPGPGAYTFYFPNNLSGRLMMYHDHTSGITKVNVYQGQAAGYVVYDPVELTLVANALGTTLATTAGGLPVGLLDSVGIPLVIQDKTFVPKNIGPNAVASDGFTPQSQDAKWDLNHWGQPGDLFFPHVYETNQDPNSIDGANPVGRWDWGPWFWPVFPAQFSLPTGAYGDATATPEAFLDTSVVNGQAYPTLTVDPKTYRFRILSVANDRSHNLGLYQAVDANGVVCNAANTNPARVATAPGGTAPPALCTEVAMVAAVPTAGFPASWPTDGRVGGVPNPAHAGPDIVQIGSEGGLLPAPAIWKSQPVVYDMNVRNITVFNILQHQLLLMGGERADVLIDFSKYAGQTLILYNDAPAPMPGYDPRIDYYTGMGDHTDAGGSYDTLPGYGPNTRTVMQIKVNNIAPAAPLNVAALFTTLPAAYAQTQPAPIIPEAAYNAPFGTANVNNYAAIGTGSGTQPLFSYQETVNGLTTTKTLPVINKAIQELFDPVYGRMNATLAVELPKTTATIATTIPLAYIDVPVDSLDAIHEDETQIWKVTHNGVDSHPVHFHMVNVQVINRVGWDGQIKPPAPNEVGWKETLRMNPLEDVYVAVKAVRPVAPFGVPRSARVLDPSQAVDAQLGFTQIDPTSGQAPRTQTWLTNGISASHPVAAYSNQFTDFDNEYVWHCHILGHEEQDFMRPFVFHPIVVLPDAPAAVTVAAGKVSWTDTTPVGGQDAQGIPTAGSNAAHPAPTSSPKNEIGFKVYKVAPAAVPPAVAPPPTLVATLPANTTSWTDASVSAADVYQVVAYNAIGDSLPGISTTTTGAGKLTGTPGVVTPPPSTAAPVTGGPAGPAGLTQTLNADGSVTLSWTGVAGATGYVVTVNGVNLSVAPGTSFTVPAASLKPNAVNAIAVFAQTLSGNTAAVTTAVYDGKAYPPVALTSSQGNQGNGSPRGSITLTWANNPLNVNNVTGLTLTWVLKDGGTPASMTFDPTATGTTIINLSRDKDYSFTLLAKSNLGTSTPVSIMGLSSP
jgi:FtsP/CotA-like multicopper oxidase with cupredoxin domain